MMQGGNRFLDFANEIMARHRGLGFGFEPAAMLYLEDQERIPEEQTAAHQNITTNLYHIQNIKEENYLFKQNLSFLTQILENKMYQNLYPTVEKQIEKVIREEMPQAETNIINSVSQQLLQLVKQGGVEQFELVREKILSEYKETEKTTLKEQETLFRKIENIWNSSIYQQAAQKKNHTTINQSRMDFQNNSMIIQNNQLNMNQSNEISIQQNQQIQKMQQIPQTEIVHPEILNSETLESKIVNSETFNYQESVKENHYIQNSETRHKESVLERTLKVVETQNELLTRIQNYKTGNLGKYYETMVEVPLEYIQEQPAQSTAEILHKLHQNRTEQIKESIIHRENINNKEITALESIHLEYPSEETTQFNQEMIQMLHSEIQRIPEVPEIVKAITEKNTEKVEKSTEVISTQDIKLRLTEKTRSISEQILSRMDNIINVSVSDSSLVTNTITNTVSKTITLNKLSHAIMEYAESKTTSEQLQTNMMRILEDYQTEVISVPGTDRIQMVYNNRAEVVTIEKLKNNMNRRLIQSIHKQGSTPALIQAMEPAAIVYRSEESTVPEQQEKTKQLEKQVNEVVKTIKNVEQKTIVQKEQLIEEQRKVVHEVLKENPAIWTEGKGAGYIRNEVQQSVEEQINQSVNQIANRVYRRLEDKLKSERGRRGLI